MLQQENKLKWIGAIKEMQDWPSPPRSSRRTSAHSDVMMKQQSICYLCSVEQRKGHDTVLAEAGRTERQRELEASRRSIQQRMQDRDGDVKALQQEVGELIRLIERKRCEVRQEVRSQQEKSQRAPGEAGAGDL